MKRKTKKYLALYIDMNKFPDDSKIGRQISSNQEALALQSELNRMHELVVIWQMDFSISMCIYTSRR